MIGIRIKEERERLGHTQPVFAEFANAKKRTLIDWEKGVSSPTAVQLSALSEIGVDVMYVLTGQRIPLPGELLLKPDEAALLDNYRHSPDAQKDLLKATSAAFAQQNNASKSA